MFGFEDDADPRAQVWLKTQRKPWHCGFESQEITEHGVTPIHPCSAREMPPARDIVGLGLTDQRQFLNDP